LIKIEINPDTRIDLIAVLKSLSSESNNNGSEREEDESIFNGDHKKSEQRE
jgi:hypothetical protein